MDMGDSTAVFEEIQVCMEITGSRDLEYVNVDDEMPDAGTEEEVVQSIEAKTEIKAEVKIEFRMDEHDNHAVMATSGIRDESLPTIGEEAEAALEGENERRWKLERSFDTDHNQHEEFFASYNRMKTPAEHPYSREESELADTPAEATMHTSAPNQYWLAEVIAHTTGPGATLHTSAP